MRHFAFILALHFSFFATQPAWQPLMRLLPINSCGEVSKMAAACSSTDAGPICPEDEDHPGKGCCTPFSCCFPCCCFINHLYRLDLSLYSEKKIRPGETTDLLFSQYISDCFHPPELLYPA